MSFSSLSIRKRSRIFILMLLLGIILVISANGHWGVDLFSHFYYFYISLVFVLMLIFAFLKDLKFVMLSIALLSAALYITFSSKPNYLTNSEKSNLVVYYQNINSDNDQANNLSSGILQLRPNIITLVETTPALEAEFDTKFSEYKKIVSLPRDDNFGFSVYSNRPLEILEVEEAQGFPVFIRMRLEEDKIDFFFVHLPPPLWKEYWNIQGQALNKIKGYWISSKGQNIVIAGDFNMTPWSHHYSHFFNDVTPSFYTSHLNFQGTWPAAFPKMWQLPIDHVFSTKPFGLEVQKENGSDHRGFLIKL